MKNLGQAYFLKKDTKTAEEVLMEALKIFQKNQHPEQYSTLELLADLYIQKLNLAPRQKNPQVLQELTQQTRQYLNQALLIAKKYFPENAKHILNIQSKLDRLESM